MRHIRKYLPAEPSCCSIKQYQEKYWLGIRKSRMILSIYPYCNESEIAYLDADEECTFVVHSDKTAYTVYNNEISVEHRDALGDEKEIGCDCIITDDFVYYQESRAYNYIFCRYCGYYRYIYLPGNETEPKVTGFMEHIKECAQMNPLRMTYTQIQAAIMMYIRHQRRLTYALEICI